MNDPSRLSEHFQKVLEIHHAGGLRCCLLGGFRITRGDQSLTIEQIHLHKARDLLKVLALAPRRSLHRESLYEMLWPVSSPRSAAHNLSQILYNLRPKLAALDPSARLEFEDERLVWTAAGGISTDVDEFEQLARAAISRTEPANSQAAAACQEAVLAYTGDLLPQDGPSGLFNLRRDELSRLYLNLLLQLADIYLELKDYLHAIDVLHKAILADPASEEAHTRLMRAYALTGQRQAALRQFQVLEQTLRHDLDVSPSQESLLLHEQIRSGALSPPDVSFEWLFSPHHNLPALVSSFIGRITELVDVQALVRFHRLVTLIGAGGVGKSRLALKTAEDLLGDFPQGVFWVELAPLSQPDLVARTALKVFHLPPHMIHNETEQLVDFIKNRHLLLLLDNCEHLLSSCASLVDTLLKACPRLHILITSRIRLNLPGEITFLVPSLAAPDSALNRSLLELAQYDAVRLFTERSSNCSQGFTLTADNAAAVVQICRRLDGIPLALELAAARSRLMSPEQIAAQLTDMFHLLIGGSPAALPRHRTLHASIEWSVSLLSLKERLLLQRLSIFSGGWSLQGAQAVCAGQGIHPSEVLDLLAGLIDHSLVITGTPDGTEVRYHLLETMRQFAHTLLQQSGQELALRQHHLEYYLQLSEQAEEELRGPHQLVWNKRLGLERGNLIEALEWSLGTHDHLEKGVNLVNALSDYWGKTGDFSYLAQVLGKALSMSVYLSRTAARARLLTCAGRASMWRQQRFFSYSQGLDFLEESLKIWRELGEDYLYDKGICLTYLGYLLSWYLGWMQKNDSNVEEGLAYLNAALDIFEQLDSTWWLAWAKSLVWDIFEQRDDAQTVRALWEEDFDLVRKTGDRALEAVLIMDWGQFALRQGNFSEAMEYFLSSLKIYAELGWKGNYVYQILRDLGHAARALQEYDQALLYSAQSSDLAEKIGWTRFTSNCSLGFTYLYTGDDRRAQAYFVDALQSAQRDNRMDLVLFWIACLASLFVVRGKLEDAARLFGACMDRLDTHQEQLALIKAIDLDHFFALCQDQLQKAAFSEAWEAGSLLTFEQALAFAHELLE
jgi:predicted ATPase/DNA-binding SARP family transcriptional activator